MDRPRITQHRPPRVAKQFEQFAEDVERLYPAFVSPEAVVVASAYEGTATPRPWEDPPAPPNKELDALLWSIQNLQAIQQVKPQFNDAGGGGHTHMADMTKEEAQAAEELRNAPIDLPPTEVEWDAIRKQAKRATEDGCFICGEHFRMESQVLLPCAHTFHMICLENYMSNIGRTCPFCPARTIRARDKRIVKNWSKSKGQRKGVAMKSAVLRKSYLKQKKREDRATGALAKMEGDDIGDLSEESLSDSDEEASPADRIARKKERVRELVGNLTSKERCSILFKDWERRMAIERSRTELREFRWKRLMSDWDRFKNQNLYIEDSCVICGKEFEVHTSQRKLHCGHGFHTGCFEAFAKLPLLEAQGAGARHSLKDSPRDSRARSPGVPSTCSSRYGSPLGQSARGSLAVPPLNLDGTFITGSMMGQHEEEEEPPGRTLREVTSRRCIQCKARYSKARHCNPPTNGKKDLDDMEQRLKIRLVEATLEEHRRLSHQKRSPNPVLQEPTPTVNSLMKAMK